MYIYCGLTIVHCVEHVMNRFLKIICKSRGQLSRRIRMGLIFVRKCGPSAHCDMYCKPSKPLAILTVPTYMPASSCLTEYVVQYKQQCTSSIK